MSRPRMPCYLESAIVEARALRIDRMSDSELAARLGIAEQLVARVRDEVRQPELPLVVSVEERHRQRVRAALARYEARQRRGRR